MFQATRQESSESKTSRIGRRPGAPSQLGNQAMLYRLQTKLTVSHPGDPAELEADRVADQVMRMTGPAIMRKCAGCEDEDKRNKAGPILFGRSDNSIQRAPDPGAKKPDTPAATFTDCDDSQMKALKGVAERAKAWNSNAREVFSDDARAKSLVASERIPVNIAELRQQYSNAEALFNQGIVIQCGSPGSETCKKGTRFEKNTFVECGTGLASAPEDYLTWELLSCVLTGGGVGNFSLAATYALRLGGGTLTARSRKVPDLDGAVVESAEQSISAGKNQEAIDTLLKGAVAVGRIKADFLLGKTMHYDSTLTQEGLTDNPQKNQQGQILPINVRIGSPAFKFDVSWLYSTLLHEYVHVEQFQPESAGMPVVVKGESTDPGFVSEKEVEAYAFEITHSDATGVKSSPDRIAEIWGRLCHAYGFLTPGQKNSVEDLARKAYEQAKSIFGDRLIDCLKSP